jgi:ABC-type glycerol-3-phosphate transport system substrate-binding protein
MMRLALALLCLVSLLCAAGCPKPPQAETKAQPPTPAGEAVTLTVWDWHAADPSKGVGLWLTEIDREFERANPNVKIKHVAQSHTEYYEIFKAAAAAASPERGPDVVMLHQGSRIMDNTGSLTPLTEYVTPEFRKKLVGWEVTCEGYDTNGTPWAVPIAVQGLVWYYHKGLLKEAGLDPARPPRTWKDFLAACEAMRKIGKAGIAVGEKEGFWSDWFINSAYFQTMTPEDKAALVTGKMKWTDPKAVALVERLKELADRGCFQEGAMATPLFPDAGEAFMRGDAAFFLGLISDVAHWKEFGEMIGAENLGVMTCPVFQDGPNASKLPTGGAFAYAVTKWCLHPKEAFDYIAFIANDDHAATFLTEVGSFPANQTYDASLIEDPNAQAIAGWLAEGRTGPQMTDMTPTEVGEALRRECQRVLTAQTTVEAALAAVQKAADGVAAQKGAGP